MYMRTYMLTTYAENLLQRCIARLFLFLKRVELNENKRAELLSVLLLFLFLR